jgi:methionine-rich copper-binding protein CopC
MKTLLSIVALSAALGAASALAHTELSQTVPADKAVLETAPKEVMLHFTEVVRLTSVALRKEGGAASELGPLPAGKSRHFAVPARELSAGAYTVEWRALSDDGHALRGAFGFTAGTASSGAVQQSTHADSSDHAQHSERSEHSQPH